MKDEKIRTKADWKKQKARIKKHRVAKNITCGNNCWCWTRDQQLSEFEREYNGDYLPPQN